MMIQEAVTPLPHEQADMAMPVDPIHGDIPPMPWYNRYRSLLNESLRCTEYSMLDCPSLWVCVASTADQNPIECLQQVGSVRFGPSGFHNGQFDPATAEKIFVLVHDVSEAQSPEAAHRAQELLNQAKQTFGIPFCHLLQINSLSSDALNLSQPDVWSDVSPPRFFPEDLVDYTPTCDVVAACLSGDDMLGIREFVQQVSIISSHPLRANISGCIDRLQERRFGVGKENFHIELSGDKCEKGNEKRTQVLVEKTQGGWHTSSLQRFGGST